jgi:hypothetical protein
MPGTAFLNEKGANVNYIIITLYVSQFSFNGIEVYILSNMFCKFGREVQLTERHGYPGVRG